MPNGFGSWGHPLDVVAAAVRDAVWTASARTLTGGGVNAVRDAVWTASARTMTHVGVHQAVASDTVQLTVPDLVQNGGTGYMLARQVRFTVPGTYRLKYELANYAKAYFCKNGKDVADAFHQENHGGDSSWVQYTLDVSVAPGETIEAWLYKTGGAWASWRNFLVCASYQYVETPTFGPVQEV